ncbi:P-loop containing nucleoside triphosphate hydrolase protein [Mycena kentingensis (nom. inval.)]|nr:P-loop containing nucleoside triphosphate hydrolase protein [Mycena kentingensis (nom. inval.)]
MQPQSLPETPSQPLDTPKPSEIRELPVAELESLIQRAIPSRLLPRPYIDELAPEERVAALRCVALSYFSHPKRIVPRPFQLQCTLALFNRRSVLVDAGTGSGKTLCQILPNLAFPASMSITVSPLKRLQTLQAAELESWGIRVVCVNEDTPSNPLLWKNIEQGHYQHLIVQPEQLGPIKGHIPRLARLLDKPKFVSLISRYLVLAFSLDFCPLSTRKPIETQPPKVLVGLDVASEAWEVGGGRRKQKE